MRNDMPYAWLSTLNFKVMIIQKFHTFHFQSSDPQLLTQLVNDALEKVQGLLTLYSICYYCVPVGSCIHHCFFTVTQEIKKEV